MSQQITIGGNRLGSGKKMKTSLNDYERSTHNLSKKWASSLAPGIIYPCYKRLCTRGDHFEINMDGAIRTIPTKGPLFGTYKMQVDFFQVPIRLYVALLHNNAVKLGMNMNQVCLPVMQYKDRRDWSAANATTAAFSNNCLAKYMGLSGIGVSATLSENTIWRELQCVPMLAYYDIFKCYYANKQEDNAYVITGDKHNQAQLSLKSLQYKYSPYTNYTTADDPEDRITVGENTGYAQAKWTYQEDTQGSMSEGLIMKSYVTIGIAGETAKSRTWKELFLHLKGLYTYNYVSPANGEGTIFPKVMALNYGTSNGRLKALGFVQAGEKYAESNAYESEIDKMIQKELDKYWK